MERKQVGSVTHRARRRSFLAVACLALALSSGCSRIYIESTPFGDKEYRVDTRENAERVNGWPLLYHRGETASVLWPIFQKTDKGHMLLPIYTYEDDPKRLLTGLGILSDFQYDKKQYRVANFEVSRKKDSRVAFIPFYFQRFGEKPRFILVPICLWEKGRDGKPDTFISLPFSKGKDFLNIGALLFHRHTDDEGVSTMAGAWFYLDELDKAKLRRTNHFFPLWFYSREGSGEAPDAKSLWVGPGIYRSKTSKESGGTYRSLLWPMAQWWRNEKAEGAAVLPIFYRDARENGDHTTVSVPYSSWKRGAKEGYNVGPALALGLRDGQDSYETFAWLYHAWRSASGRGHALLPLYRWARLAGGGFTFNSLLYNRHKSEGSETINAGGPLFYASEGEGERFMTLFWPLYQQWRAPERRADALFPLLYREQSPEKSVLATPLFFSAKSEDRSFLNVLLLLLNRIETPESSKTITPVASWGRSGDKAGFANVLGLLAHREWDADGGFAFLTPLAGWWRNANARGSWLAPFFIEESKEKAHSFFSLPLSFRRNEDGTGWTNVGALLAHHEREKDWSHGDLLKILGYETRELKLDSLWAFPLFGWEPDSFDSIVFSRYDGIPSDKELEETGQEARKALEAGSPYDRSYHKGWRFLTLARRDSIRFAVRETTPTISAGSTKTEAGETDRQTLPEVVHSLDCFPFFNRKHIEGDKVETQVLGGLFWKGETRWIDKGDKAMERKHNRLFWKVVDYEKLDNVTTVDAFPFLTYDRDRKKDYASASFLGPIWRRTRLGGERQLRLFGLKFGDDIELVDAGADASGAR